MHASKLRSTSAFRFTAGHLFYFIWLCATSTALLGWAGIPLAGFILLVWVQILGGARREAELTNRRQELAKGQPSNDLSRRPDPAVVRHGLTKLELLVALLIATLLIGLFMPAANEYDPMRQAELSMKIVAKAVAAYEQEHGQIPPSISTDNKGQTYHSWRALILPYLEEEKLAASMRWDEPWNSSNNTELSQYRPWHFRTYYPHSDEQRETSSLQLMRDAQQNWFVVEHERAIGPWLRPTQAGSWSALEHLPIGGQGFWHRGFFVSCYRGRLAVSCQQTLLIHPMVSRTVPLEQCVADCVLTGEERAELGRPFRQIHWDNALRLSMFLLAVLYPLRWLSVIRDGAVARQ